MHAGYTYGQEGAKYTYTCIVAACQHFLKLRSIVMRELSSLTKTLVSGQILHLLRWDSTLSLFRM